MFREELWAGRPLLITFFLGLLFVLFYYWYSTRNADYWKKRGIPYVKPVLPFFGSTFPLLLKPHHELEWEWYQNLGPVYGHFEGSRPVLSVAEPKLLRDIFVKEFASFPNRRDFFTGNNVIDNMLFSLTGEDWKRVRSIVSTTFTTGKIKRIVSIIKDCSQTLMQNLKSISKSGKHFDAKEFYGAFTLDVIASSAFSTKLDSLNDPKNRFVQIARMGFTTNFSLRIAFYQLFPWLMRVLKIPLISSTSTSFYRDLSLQMIEHRRKTGQTRNDFLQLLMDTSKEVSDELEWAEDKDDITSNYGQDESTHLPAKYIPNKSLSLDEVVGQCVNFFLAGYDTASSTLSYVSYLLALHPEIQSKVYDEISEVLENYKGELTYEALQEMKYLDNVISETLRIYPPVYRLERLATSDCRLGNTGITVPKGMIISIPNYALHNDPKYFPEPKEFNPDRFTPEERGKRDPYVYLPFGSGPRVCVGMRFALMELKVCLAYVISNFELQRCSETKIPLEFSLGPGLLHPKSLVLKLEERTIKILLK